MNDTLAKKNLESYFKCKYKFYLYFIGEKGVKSDYEELIAESRLHFKQKVIQKILAHSSESEFSCSNVTLTHQLLQQGTRYIFNGVAREGNLSLFFDGLKKVEGPLKAENFIYIPILISESENIHSEERRLLALYGLVLASIQGRHPHEGLFIHGQQLKTTKVKLNSTDRKIRRVLEEIKDIQKGVSTPPLILNNHCQICEFQQPCYQKAVDADNMSLLRGMTEKRMIIYSRRGIFTVAQLSHTYRARRNNPRKSTPRHDLALQALAIREKRVYITEVPSLRHESVNIFLDIEGIPERCY